MDTPLAFPHDDPAARAASAALQRSWAAVALNGVLFSTAAPSIFLATLWTATADPLASMTMLLHAGMRCLLIAVFLANGFGLVLAAAAWSKSARAKVSRAPAIGAVVLGLLSLGFWLLAGIAMLSSAAATN
jgi:hypothetical protein